MIKLFFFISKTLSVIFTIGLGIRSSLHASMVYILNLQKLDMDKCIVNNTFWPFFYRTKKTTKLICFLIEPRQKNKPTKVLKVEKGF